LKVDYSMDDQWNMWVKVGVRKLVSIDGVTTLSRTEQALNLGEQNCHPVVNDPSTSAWHHSSPMSTATLAATFVATINESVHSPLQASWNTEQDNELNQSGHELLNELGWDLPRGTHITPSTPVSNGVILPAVCASDPILDSPQLLSYRVCYR
jgi:hypothetical protein